MSDWAPDRWAPASPSDAATAGPLSRCGLALLTAALILVGTGAAAADEGGTPSRKRTGIVEEGERRIDLSQRSDQETPWTRQVLKPAPPVKWGEEPQRPAPRRLTLAPPAD